MRKLLVLLVLICSLVLVGCSFNKKQVKCTQTASNLNVEYNVEFVMNKIKTINFSSEMDLSKYSDVQIEMFKKQDFCNLFKQSTRVYKNAFDSCDQKVINKRLKVDADLNIKKIDKGVLKKMNTPKSTKKYLENIGYTCTIK